jgi:transcriptional regulator with PAS, ATPase and Fis domain
MTWEPCEQNPQQDDERNSKGDQRRIGDTVAVIRSDTMHRLMAMVERVARQSAAVLIVGETGSGKEVVARAIHQHSLRSSQPFVDVNCGALPEHLVESELFGYEKGAFSGAESQKPGLFELADKGTLLLDEIAEIDSKTQVKLLRVLDGVPYYRLGGSRKVSVDVRILAATNQDMEGAVRSGKFRSDLYHRLNQFQLRVPPLRERPEDIGAIAEYILEQHHPECRFSPEALRLLETNPWPGNVRELKNVLLKGVLHLRDNQRLVTAADVAPYLPTSTVQSAPSDTFHGSLSDMEKRMILDTLARTGGDQNESCRILGISRKTLSRKLQQYDAESTAQSLGAISSEQQRYFRVAVPVPVRLHADGAGLSEATIINVGMGGVALHAERVIERDTELELSFTLPDPTITIQAQGQVVWTASDGTCGLKFTAIRPATRKELERWLLLKAKVEGWAVPADKALAARAH